MWSNARGCPRVNGGGPLAVLATSVCSGRGGRRLVFQLSQGGAPPHTPPRRSTRGFLGLRCRTGGCAGWAAGFPRRLLALIRARGEGAPSGLWWRAWGVCRVGCGVPPQAFCLRVVGEGQSSQGGAPPTPPLDDPLGVPGLRCQAGGCAGWAAGCPRRRSASGLWARGEGAPSAPPGGGVGAQPPHKESPRAGGWATSRAARSSGMGRGGAAPAGGARSPSKACRPAGAGPPHPQPLPQGARGPDRPRGLCLRRPIRTGAWGLGVRCSRRSAGSPRSPR